MEKQNLCVASINTSEYIEWLSAVHESVITASSFFMSVLLALILTVILFMIFLSLVLFVIGPIMLLQPNRRTVEFYRKYTTLLLPKDAGLPYEELTLKTAEGIGLRCWLIKAPHPTRGTVIYLHGVSECVIVGLPMTKTLHDQGFNVFLYDSRRHGESGGKYCTYGFYEKHDVSTVINYLEQRADVNLGNIGLFGSSMGAAVAVQAAAIDKRVRAVVAESGFATLRTVFDDYQKRMIKMPWHYLRNLVIKRSERLAHFKANAVSPLDAVKDVHVPIFILHGTADDRIKYQYSELLYNNTGPPKELWLIAGAKHHNMAERGGEEYTRRIVNFFKQNL
jgi:alpha-beta hydrolase superfamily lysophospholipase